MSILADYLGTALGDYLGIAPQRANMPSQSPMPTQQSEPIRSPVAAMISAMMPQSPAAAMPPAQAAGAPRLADSSSPMRAAKFQGARPEDSSPELYSKIADTEQRYGLPQGILAAIKDKGEKSGSNATSPVGAQGIFQFMPSTWRPYGGDSNPRDPFAAVEAAGKFVRDLLKQYNGNVAAAVAHYNGGTKQGRLVMEGKEPSYEETRNYVRRVLA